MNSFLQENLSLNNLKRINLGWKYIFGLTVLLLCTSDLFNYLNNVWEEFPSQYYVFIIHLISIPIFIGLYFINKYVINNKLYYKESYSRWMMALNVIAFAPIIGAYYYWDIKDYNSSGVYLIYIFIYSFLMRLPKKENILLFAYFSLGYFGMLGFFSIAYVNNPSLYLNGIAAIFICYGINRALFQMEIDRNSDLWKINQKNVKIHQLNLELQKNNTIIQKQNDEISAINLCLENYACIAAHDIKAPLNTLHSYLEYISAKYGDLFSSEEHKQTEVMLKTSKNMSGLVDSLFQFSKLKFKKNELQNIDLNEIAAEVAMMLDAGIRKKSAMLSIQKNIPQVQGFKELSQHLILNIVNNALKFSKEGIAPEIEIKFQEKENYILLEIKDNGIGIPKIYHREIFKIFRKLNENDFEGNGLGLGNSKKIMSLQKGDIWVESVEGQGSSFFMLFLKSNEIHESFDQPVKNYYKKN